VCAHCQQTGAQPFMLPAKQQQSFIEEKKPFFAEKKKREK
jgi:hypothetical protein